MHLWRKAPGVSSRASRMACPVRADHRPIAGRQTLFPAQSRQARSAGREERPCVYPSNFLSSSDEWSALPQGPKSLFLFWTVHGPFSLFLRSEKEKMGGAMNQPSSWLNSTPPVRARKNHPRPKGGHPPVPGPRQDTPPLRPRGAKSPVPRRGTPERTFYAG